MSNPESLNVAAALKHLSDFRQDPVHITEGYMDGVLDPHLVVMTSVGDTRRAIVTPAFPGMQFLGDLRTRLTRARVHNRPFIEARVHFSRRREVAAVMLRSCFNPAGNLTTLETAWTFPLNEDAAGIITFDDVVDSVIKNRSLGQPVAARSGLIEMNTEREKTNNWAITHHIEPETAAASIHHIATQLVEFSYV